MLKVKVTRPGRPTNNETDSESYPPNGKTYELQTWYTDGARRPVSKISDMSSKVKEQGLGDLSGRFYPISQERKVSETPKLVWRLPTPCTIKRWSFKGKRSKVKVTRPINAHTVYAKYLPKGNDYEQLQSRYTDGARIPVSPTIAVTSTSSDVNQPSTVEAKAKAKVKAKYTTPRPNNLKVEHL